MANETSVLLPEHEEFNAKMENAKTEEEAILIMKEFGFEALPDFGELLSENAGELSERQLEAVVGGARDYTVIRTGVPVFDRTIGIGRKIIGTLRQGDIVRGEIVKAPKIFTGSVTWIHVVFGNGRSGFVNSINLK